MLIGREKEVTILNDLLHSEESELVSIIGRRRVGKTYLVQSVFKNRINFEVTGIQHATNKEQLENFAIALGFYTRSSIPLQRPISWLEAFRLLILHLESRGNQEKQVVFFDELPWLDGHRSGFLNAFGFFWNSWAVKNKILVVICGSAASWMIKKVVQNKGGLYNRITKRIHLNPFSLRETELFLQSRALNLNRYQITELYMAVGGIPHYLKEIQKGESVAQSIDRICFEPQGTLFDEFGQLYPSLFEQADNHMAVGRALATKWSGLTRTDISSISGISNGGGLTKTLEELQYSGFIAEYLPFGRVKRETIYRLTDEYSLFYLKFIETMKKEGAGIWKNFQATPSYRTWSGYAFESICLKHLPEIKRSLGIAGIFSTSSAFYRKGTEGMAGCQIDLLIDRDDKVINLCEIKWSNSEFILTKKYAAELREKAALFQHYSKTKKQIFITFISTYGVLQNEHSQGLIDKEIKLAELFG
jgi:uncharacterized protein